MFSNFLDLQQCNMIVTQYDSKFVELFYFATKLVSTDAKKANRFEQCQKPSIQGLLIAHRLRKYKKLVKKAMIVERDLEDKQNIRSHQQDKGSQTENSGSGNH